MAKKDFGKRLIPEYLLKYSEDLHKNHPDPSASWGGSGGSTYTAGDGIDITNNVISVDDTIAKKSDIPSRVKSPFLGVRQITDGTVLFSETGEDDDYYSVYHVIEPVRVNLRALNPNFGSGLTSSYNTSTRALDVAVDTTTVALKSEIPTKTSELTNDSGYATQTWVQNQGYSTFSGSYNDLLDKPTIPDGATNPFLRVTDANDTVFFSLDGTPGSFYKLLDVASQSPIHVNLHALNPVFGNGLTSTYNTSKSQLEVAVDTSVVALKSDIPDVPSTDNLVTTDTAQTITGLKTIGQNSGNNSEVDFNGFTFILANKLINNPEADIKIVSGSSDDYLHPIVYSSKGLYVNLAKIKLGDNGNNRYGITMPDSSTWGADRVLATTADIPAVPTVNDSTITFTQGGVTKGSFSLNQASNQTIELDAGGAQAPAFEITNMVVDSSAQTITLTITQNN